MPIDGELLPVLTDTEGLLTDREKADELGITRRALYNRRAAAVRDGLSDPDHRPAGVLVDRVGSNGSILYWHPSGGDQ